jgi:hypothetical protein
MSNSKADTRSNNQSDSVDQIVAGSDDLIIFSQKTAISKGYPSLQGGVWSETLAKPIVLKPGDSIQCGDVILSTPQDNISIDVTETNPYLVFGYYDRFYDFTDRVIAGRTRACVANDLNYDYHIAYSDRATSDVQTVRFRCDSLSSWGLFRAVFNYLNTDGTPGSKTVIVPFEEQTFAGVTPTQDIPFGETITAGTLQLVSPSAVSMQKNNNTIYDPTHNVTVPGAGPLKLDRGQFTWNLDSRIYTRNALAKELTDQADLLPNASDQILLESFNPFLVRTDDVNTDEIRFLRATAIEPVTTDGFEYYNLTTSSRNAYWYGASEVSIEYDEDEREIFEFTFLHTPLYNPADAATPTQNIAWYKAPSNGRWNSVEQATGVFLIDMQPRSFWVDKMGFDPDRCLVNIIEGPNLEYVTRADLDLGSLASDAKVTKGPITLTSLFPNYDRKISDDKDTIYVDVTGLSVPIKANEPTIGTAQPCYLISMKGLQFSFGETVDSAASMPNICFMVPGQNIANDFVTGYSDSGKRFTNTSGQDIIISEAYIEVLDYITKQPAPGLGLDNIVTFNILRQGS